MGFLDGLFENKANKKKKQTELLKPLSTDSVGRAVNSYNSSYWNLGAGKDKMDLEKAISKAYERVIWVFRCVDIIASNQANIPMLIKKYDSDYGVIVEDKVFNRLVNRKTNPFEDSWSFRYRLSSILLLSPKGAFIELVRNSAGDIVEMYLLDPGTVEPIKDDKKWVKGYKVKRGTTSETLDPEQIIWVKLKAHPLDVYSQMTPLIPSILQVETDFLARTFNKNFLKNDGRPGMLIGIDGDMSSEDAEELRNLFSGGYAMAGQTRVIESENIHVVDLSAKPRDVQWEDAIKNAKEDILLAFGVPESVLGNSSGRCLRASEKVYLSNGSVKRAEELVGQKFKLLQPTFDQGQIEVDAIAEYANFEPIFKITTFSGRTIETNAQHPLYMASSASRGPFKRDIFTAGWTPVSAIKEHFEKYDQHVTNMYTELAVPIAFDQVGGEDLDYDTILELGERSEVFPEYLFTADQEAQRVFLSGLYTKHGLLSQHTSWDIYAPTRDYAVKLQILLQRIGVHSSISTKKLKHVVAISGKINMFNFLSQLDLTGDNGDKARAVWNRLSAETSREHNAFRSDSLPPGLIWDRIYSVEEIGQDQTVALTVEGDHHYLSSFWEHNTYNNAEGEEETFWTKTMIPHCEALARNLEPLTGDDQDQTYITFDYETVDILQRIKRRREDAIKQDFARGMATLNDVMKEIGRKEINSPYARVYYHPSRLIGGENPLDVEAVRNMPVIGATTDSGPGMNNPFANSTPTGGDGTVGGTNDLVQGELAGNGVDGATQTVNDQAARTLRSASTLGIANDAANPVANVNISERIDSIIGKKTYEVKQIETNIDPHANLKTNIKGLVEGHLDSWSDNQLTVAKDRVNHVKVRKGTRHWEGATETKDLDTSYVIDAQEWASKVSKSVLDNIYRLLLSEAHVIANDALDQGYFAAEEGKTALETILGPKYQAEIKNCVLNTTKQIFESAKNQSALVAKHIGVLDISGKSINEIQDTLVAKTFDRSNWSKNLSNMISTHAVESLSDLIYSNIDANVYKIWCSGKDEHYRKGHGDIHGTKKAIDKSFSIGDFELKYPTDGFNSEGYSCSCWIRYGIED